MKYQLLIILLLTSLFSQAQLNLELQADSLFAIEEYKKAKEIYSNLVNQKEIKADVNTLLRVSTNLAIAMQKDREDEDGDRSIEVLEKAIKTVGNQTVSDSILGLAYHKLGVGFYNIGDDLNAIKNWEKTIEIRQKILPSNHTSIIKSYRNIGNSYYYLEMLDEASATLKKALDLLLTVKNPDEVMVLQTYSSLSSITIELEDFDKAENYLSIAKDIVEQSFADEPWEIAEIYELLFDLRKRQNNTEGMKKYSQGVIDIYEGFEDLEDEDYTFLANANNNLGLTYMNLKQWNQAAAAFEKSIQLNESKREERYVQLGQSYGNLSIVYRIMGDFSKAQKAVEQSITIFKEFDDSLGEAENINNKAEILLAQNQSQEALTQIDNALEMIYPEEGKLQAEKPMLGDFLFDKMRILYALAQKENKQENLNKAADISNQIMTLFDEIRLEYQSDASKSFLSKKSKEIIAKAVQIQLDLYQINQDKSHLKKAFELAEKSKSLILLDALNEAQAKQTTGVPTQLLDREITLKKGLALLQKQLYEGTEEATDIQKEIVNINRQLEKLVDTLEQNYTSYFDAKYNNSKLDLAVLQKKLNGTIIEYFLTEEKIYAFILDTQYIDVVEIPRDFDLSKTIQTLRASIYDGFLNASRSDKENQIAANTLVNTAYLLYQKLIEPIEQIITLDEKLTIIPDGILGYIPFEVLLSNKVEQSMLFGNHPYLLKEYQISYCYSATLLKEMEAKENTNPSGHFIAFAPSFAGETAPEETRRVAVRARLSPLDYNIPEIESLQDLMGGSIFTAQNATEENFNQNAPNHQIIHLATHGKANDLAGDYAYLAFTQVQDSIENEFLYNRDLYNLQLNADMVVLSACETGIGELKEGEGIISLARGFSYAGAKSIITTLWSINDEKTKEVMVDFYTQLLEHTPKDVALRQAKLNFIKKYSHTAHPFFWAAFIPIGDMESVYISKGFSIWVYGSLGFMLLLLLFFFTRRK